MNIAYETQDILVGASNALHHQGKQLSKSARTMEKIHNDITVADRITGDIESWFGAWRVKKKFESKLLPTDDNSSTNSNRTIEFPVLYGKIPQESHNCGEVLFRNDNFELLDEKCNVLHSFPINTISDVKVHSPWDITITKRNIGRPSVVLHLTSARMPILLKKIQYSVTCNLKLNSPPIKTPNISEVEDLGATTTPGKF